MLDVGWVHPSGSYEAWVQFESSVQRQAAPQRPKLQQSETTETQPMGFSAQNALFVAVGEPEPGLQSPEFQPPPKKIRASPRVTFMLPAVRTKTASRPEVHFDVLYAPGIISPGLAAVYLFMWSYPPTRGAAFASFPHCLAVRAARSSCASCARHLALALGQGPTAGARPAHDSDVRQSTQSLKSPQRP